MDTALLAAICMGKNLLHKFEEPVSLPATFGECDQKPDRRVVVTGFRQDEDGFWIAELSCGHTQHLRHQPPWQNRAWVLDPAQRQARIGTPFECGWCATGSD
ncbi:DUF3565 domain-containing protein [Pseudomonas sp. LRF_L74]|uniref:DUF3565 domain-containing protein n=1 Tax=Pseudomonas sp. LRF_L74 TaxID=3369422 RepID=UPI003F632DF5